jgi:hypothetical protein
VEGAITMAINGVLVVSLSVLLALTGLVLVNRLVPEARRRSSNVGGGLIFRPISGVFGILIGFTAFLVWQQYSTAHVTTQREASELAAIYWHAEELPTSERLRVQQYARSYASVVIEEEWPLMGQGQESSKAWATVDKLRRTVDGFEPSTSAEETLHTRQVTLVEDLLNDRRLRLLQSREGLPPILWTVLLSGTVLLVGYTYFFGLQDFRAHLLMVAMLTALIVTILFTIKSLEYPFSGDTRVEPSAFELVLNRFYADSRD